MSDYRLQFGSMAGPNDADRLNFLLSIVSEGDQLEIILDNDSTEQVNTIKDVLESNEFEITTKMGIRDGKYHLIAHRKS